MTHCGTGPSVKTLLITSEEHTHTRTHTHKHTNTHTHTHTHIIVKAILRAYCGTDVNMHKAPYNNAFQDCHECQKH